MAGLWGRWVGFKSGRVVSARLVRWDWGLEPRAGCLAVGPGSPPDGCRELVAGVSLESAFFVCCCGSVTGSFVARLPRQRAVCWVSGSVLVVRAGRRAVGPSSPGCGLKRKLLFWFSSGRLAWNLTICWSRRRKCPFACSGLAAGAA